MMLCLARRLHCSRDTSKTEASAKAPPPAMSDVYCHSGNDRGGTVCRRGPITRARICGWAKGNPSTKTQDVIPANDA